jgi:hypothetical protein
MLGLGSLDVVQRNLGIAQSGQWDAQTMASMTVFQDSGQGALAMYPTGQPDPATLINLGYYDPIEDMPRKQRDYLEGGERPSTFLRDLGTASNQVPQWIWIALGVFFTGLAYYTYRKRQKKGK